MSNALKVAAGLGAEEKLYVDDVFSTYLYTGNGSTQTITNGIDLAGKGGMVWTKGRSAAENHGVSDTVRGSNATVTNFNGALLTNATSTGSTANHVTAFNSDGFTLGSSVFGNGSSTTYASWTFRKAPKFFDVVTWTASASTETISHNLGVVPGIVIVKKTSGGAGWYVYHRSLGENAALFLNNTNSADTGVSNYWNGTAPTSTQFTVGDYISAVGSTYVAYLFAHDTATDGLIQCGSFTTDGGGNATVNLGWEPQFLLYKRADSTSGWEMLDATRAWGMSLDARLYANSSGQEFINSDVGNPTATGFYAATGNGLATYIYLAIRRPNKPPTVGTEVYNAIARTGTGAAATVTGVGFAPDLYIASCRNAVPSVSHTTANRLCGLAQLQTGATAAEQASQSTCDLISFGMDGISVGNDYNFEQNSSGRNYINHFFRRAPGVFDVVCYTGTGSATTVAHNLGVVPELMIVKRRGAIAGSWSIYHQALGNTSVLEFTTASVYTGLSGYWDSTTPTSSVLSLGGDSNVNASTGTYVTCLFATKPGISKVGSYTGNGSSQTINCGFTTGARFVLIKRTDSTGDWFVWDSTRGIVAGNDPHLSLNTTAAEVTTDDSIDPANEGFSVNQLAATNINVNNATYIFLSFA